MSDNYYVDESRIWFKPESGWPDEVPKNLDFPKKSMGQMFKDAVADYPDHKAIWFLDRFMTYRELGGHVQAMATALHQMGHKKGDVIAFLMPNSFQYVICYYACQLLGCIATGLNPTYKPGEILHQLETTGARTLIVLDALYEGQVAPIIDKSGIKDLIVTNVADFLPAFKRLIGKLLGKIPTGKVPARARKLSDLLRTKPDVPELDIDPEVDVATYIMTGGTTGVPKAAVLTHMNLVANAMQGKAWIFKVKPGACNIGVLPLFHSFAMTCVMNVSVIAGAWMMLFPRPPKTEELLRKIMKHCPDGATNYCGAEILFQRLAEMPGIESYDVKGKLALCVSGAGPLHRPVQEAFERVTGARLVEGYGLTEASPVVSGSPFWPKGERKIGTIGLPFPGTDWRIVDIDDPGRNLGSLSAEIIEELKKIRGMADDDPARKEAEEKTNAVLKEHSGEIAVAGPQVMKAYLNRPDETAETLVEMDGKIGLITGDIGYMDNDGQIVIRDRKKQLIKYKGYSVYPKEVEELVGMNEHASEVAVAGLPDEEAGEIIKAWVVLNEESEGKITEEELLAWCKKSMTHYKVPRLIEFKDDLPKTLVGKVLRRELQEADPIWKKHKEG